MKPEPSWRYMRWTDEQLRPITPDRVADYFRRQGWIEYPCADPLWRRFEHPTRRLNTGEPRYYVYPAGDDEDTYPMRVADFLVNFAQDRDISPDDLLRELTAPPKKPKTKGKPASPPATSHARSRRKA